MLLTLSQHLLLLFHLAFKVIANLLFGFEDCRQVFHSSLPLLFVERMLAAQVLHLREQPHFLLLHLLILGSLSFILLLDKHQLTLSLASFLCVGLNQFL